MKKSVKGSYTIEAALVFPLIMTVIVFIIYMSLFLHDRAAMSASLIRTGEEDMRSEAERAAAYSIDGLLLATSDPDISVTVSGKKVSIRYSGTLKIPRSILFFPISGSDSITVSGTGEAYEKDAIEFIRQCRAAGNILKMTGGQQ